MATAPFCPPSPAAQRRYRQGPTPRGRRERRAPRPGLPARRHAA